MGYNDNIVRGEVPNSGAIFMSNSGTKKECFRRKLFGLPSAKSDFVLHVKEGMMLFLFEFEKRQLFGVFRATTNGEINIEPNAFKSSGKHFPAQVRFTEIWKCTPLAEHEFKDAIRDNYFSGKKFNFGLSKDQVHRLMMLFRTKTIPKSYPTRSLWREGEKPAGKEGRFGDDRKNLIRDRIGFVNKDDSHGLGIFSELVGYEVEEAKDLVYLNGKFAEEVNDFNYGRGQGSRTVEVERTCEDNEAGFLTNYVRQSDDFGDPGQTILGKHLDHSLGGLRKVADADLCFMGDVNDEYEMKNDLTEIRGIANKDSFFMMENLKGKHNIEDGYRRQIFTEPHEKRYGKIGVASNDANFLMDSIANENEHVIDDNRMQDEYPVIGFQQSVSAYDLGSPCDRGSQMVNDGRFFSLETVESKQRTLTEHPLSKRKRTADVRITHEYDEDLSFGPRTLTEYPASKRGGTAVVGIKADFDEDLRGPLLFEPDYLSLTVDETAENIAKGHGLRLFSTFDDRDVGEPTGNVHGVGETSRTSTKFFSSDAGSCPWEDDPIRHDMKFREPRGSKRVDGTDQRVSVFARLTLAPGALRHEQEIDIDGKNKLDERTDKVMEMLEKAVSSPIKRTGKSISAFKREDDNKKHTITASKMVDSELPKVKMEPDANLANEVRVGGSISQETRLVDFKRRRKPNNSLYDKSKESSAGTAECEKHAGNIAFRGSAGTTSDAGFMEVNHLTGMSCKRRKLIRPVFDPKSVSTAANTDMQPISHENTPLKDDSKNELTQEKSFVYAMTQETIPDNDKMCGWIEW